MDFKTTEAADDLGGLARTITDSVCTNERQRELDKLDERFDHAFSLRRFIALSARFRGWRGTRGGLLSS